jgi:hypothetical protein
MLQDVITSFVTIGLDSVVHAQNAERTALPHGLPGQAGR